MPIFGSGIINTFNNTVCLPQTVLAQQAAMTQLQSNTSSTWINYSGGLLGFSCGTGNSIISCYSNQMANTLVGIIEIDEEDYVNHAEQYELARQRGVQFHIRTAEETRLRAEAAERERVEQELRERERQVIRKRARELLISHLTTEQHETFEKNKWFVVVGGKSKTEYRIRTDYGIAGNIDVMAKGKKVASLCCHCPRDIPNEDQFLAQKIALMWDEENFLKTANRCAA